MSLVKWVVVGDIARRYGSGNSFIAAEIGERPTLYNRNSNFQIVLCCASRDDRPEF